MSESLAQAEANQGPIPPSVKVTSFGRYVENVFLAADELGNAITLGSPHETISSRAYRARSRGSRGACVLCAILTRVWRLFDGKTKDHCREAYDEMSARDY
jgi:hypothetical protein